MLSEFQINRLPLSLTSSHPARRVMNSPLALTMVESKGELLPALLSTTEFTAGQSWVNKVRVSNFSKSPVLIKELG